MRVAPRVPLECDCWDPGAMYFIISLNVPVPLQSICVFLTPPASVRRPERRAAIAAVRSAALQRHGSPAGAPGVGEVVSPGLWARLSLPAVHAAVHKGTAPAAAKRAVKLRRLISPLSVSSPASIRLACGCAHGESRQACDSAKMSAAPVVAS